MRPPSAVRLTKQKQQWYHLAMKTIAEITEAASKFASEFQNRQADAYLWMARIKSLQTGYSRNEGWRRTSFADPQSDEWGGPKIVARRTI
jgi:hypothetical protein